MKKHLPYKKVCVSIFLIMLLQAIVVTASHVIPSNQPVGIWGNAGIYQPVVSANGQFVVFTTQASDLLPEDSVGSPISDVYLYDRQTAQLELVSIDHFGNGNQGGIGAAISADGRYVSFASNRLVANDSNLSGDIYIRDRQLGTTELVSMSNSGVQSNYVNGTVTSLSDDGRYVVFASYANNLVANDNNSVFDIFLRDRQLNTTRRVSVNQQGVGGNGHSREGIISADGRYIVYESYATNLIAGGTNGAGQIYLYDIQMGTTELVSKSSGGVEGDRLSENHALSADARYIVYSSSSKTLLSPPKDNLSYDLYIRDRVLSTTTVISEHAGHANITPDGRFVTFGSSSADIVANDNNAAMDIFVHDRLLNTTIRANLTASGEETPLYQGSYSPSISADGTVLAFSSVADNLVSADTQGRRYIYMTQLTPHNAFVYIPIVTR